MEGRLRVKLTEEGASKLGDTLTDNLKQYMGDFVDDTLVKYVIVLVGNGRSKEEVKEELDVFLADNTHSFVTWLWDHLSSHLHLYSSQPPKPLSAEPPDEEEKEPSKPSTSLRRRGHTRDWKGLINDVIHPPNKPPLRPSSVPKPANARQSLSPERPLPRKRYYRPDEQPQPRHKREVSHATATASRRLLQFAVREAVATTRPSSTESEPARKRLRSVVSTSTDISAEEVQPRKKQSVTRLPTPMGTAIRAVAEAAEDVKRVKSGNVFDRLRRGVEGSSEELSALRVPTVPDSEYEVYDEIHEDAPSKILRPRDQSERYSVNASMMDSNTGLASDSASDNEGYDNVNVSGSRVVGISKTNLSRGNKDDDSLMVQYSVGEDAEKITCQSRKNDQEQPASMPSTKHKIVNISVNVNTWKPPHYQRTREMPEFETQKSTQQENNSGTCNSDEQLMKVNSRTATNFRNGKYPADSQIVNLKTTVSPTSVPYSTGRPLEDSDSRTIFVNNVHFAATKDSLSRHFNKFGEVLKVIILTDAATGHPKGSAYVEFMRKEAAEKALTLDGTSFMSRIIKVVKKTAAPQEASPVMVWPRSTRGSQFTAPRFTQAPFTRVFPAAYRSRPGMKPGVRSMQWKRDAQQTSTESLASCSGTVTNATSAGRGFTYVRAESKPDGSSGGG